MDVHWFPGHMAKALKNIEEYLPLVDFIVEMADARIPRSSRNPSFLDIIGQTPHILLLNKKDLADPNRTAEWLKHYEAEGLRTLACNTQDSNDVKTLRNLALEISADKLAKIEEKGRQNRPLRIMILGIPNTGKSTLINALSAKKAAKVSNQAGVTRGPQWIKTRDMALELLDMPGVLWPKLETREAKLHLAATGAIQDRILPLEEVAYFSFMELMELYPDALKARYKLDWEDGEDTYDLYLEAARKAGAIQSGGKVDERRFASRFLTDLRNGILGPMTLETVEGPRDHDGF